MIERRRPRFGIGSWILMAFAIAIALSVLVARFVF
jgi:hypothetical protein